jgi:hypothetical protein
MEQLTRAGFLQNAQSAWWMLIVDPELKKTPFRLWESGDFESLRRLVEKTLGNPTEYMHRIEEETSVALAKDAGRSSFIAKLFHESRPKQAS